VPSSKEPLWKSDGRACRNVLGRFRSRANARRSSGALFSVSGGRAKPAAGGELGRIRFYDRLTISRRQREARLRGWDQSQRGMLPNISVPITGELSALGLRNQLCQLRPSGGKY
jgi:hypothetical protein